MKWYASKIAPKIYGEKVDVNVSGNVTVSAAIDEGRRRLARLRGEEITIQPQVVSLAAPSSEGAEINGAHDD